MKLHLNDFTAGVNEMIELHKQGNNIFEITGGSLFPHNTSQKTWEYAKEGNKLHLSDGTHTYSFKGELSDFDSELEKMPEAPLPEIFANAKTKGKAQVHRSDPGSIYFTLQEGRNNPTYTLKHTGDSKWKAIPKKKKVKDMLKEPVVPNNVNLESVKEGMLAELEEFSKEAGLDDTAGRVLQQAVNFPANLALEPARMTGQIGGNGVTEPFTSALGNAAIAGGVGALGGGAYHLAKRHLLNTQEENAQEDAEGGHALKRILAPAGVMAGMNVLGRQMLPGAINDPSKVMFPAGSTTPPPSYH